MGGPLDLLTTEGLIDAGVVDFVWNDGWRRASGEALHHAQHGGGDEPREALPERAVIACFITHFPDAIARAAADRPGGRYVFIVRDGDPSIREGGGPNCNVREWPPFIHHIFGINLIEANLRATAMPMAFHAFREMLDHLPPALEVPRKRGDGRVLVSHSLDGGGMYRAGHERLTSIDHFRDKTWATVNPGILEAGVRHASATPGWSHPEYLRRIREHDYLALPVGYGVERVAGWEAMVLGTIPIAKRHPELQHFSDMPIAFVDNWSDVTPEWCDANLDLIKRSMDKPKLSYWVERVREKRTELGI